MPSFFAFFGGFAQNVPFLILFPYCQRIFLKPILTWPNIPNRFLGFFKYIFFLIFFICVFGETRELCAKFWNFLVKIHREIICQNQLLLITFFNFPIVQCIKNTLHFHCIRVTAVTASFLRHKHCDIDVDNEQCKYFIKKNYCWFSLIFRQQWNGAKHADFNMSPKICNCFYFLK